VNQEPDHDSRRIRYAGAVLVLGLLAGTAACGPYPQSSLAPISDFATNIDDLFRTIFWWAMGVFVVVEGILLYVVVRYRRRSDDDEVAQIHGSALLEFGWTLAPAVILVLIAIPTIQTIFEVDRPPPEGTDVMPVEVIGHQWWWEFRYPESEVVTANEVHVPAGRKIEFRITSADVIHSFWFPRAGGKRDALPGDTTHLWMRIDSTGVFPGQCAEFCGESHALMQMRLIVQEPGEFRDWTARQKATPSEPTDSLALEGRRVFMGVCSACHTVRGTRARGTIGPDLTHFAERRTLAAGMLENTEENVRRWLEDPQALKPGNEMVIPDLPDDRIRALNAYLATLEVEEGTLVDAGTATAGSDTTAAGNAGTEPAPADTTTE
jgi:cytochrome c oxidase subunit 2